MSASLPDTGVEFASITYQSPADPDIEALIADLTIAVGAPLAIRTIATLGQLSERVLKAEAEAEQFRSALAITTGKLAVVREALAPFANVLIGPHRNDYESVWHSVKVQDFRRARQVIAAS